MEGCCGAEFVCKGGRLRFTLWTAHLRVGTVSCDYGQPRVGDLGVEEDNGGDVGAVSSDCGQPRIGDLSVAFDFGRVLVPRHTPRHANEGRGVAVKEAQNVVTQRLNSECASDLET